MPVELTAHSLGLFRSPVVYLNQQIPRSPRRNALPVERINRSLLMRHEYPAGALVELMQIGKTPSSPDGVLHHPPEAFDGVEVVPAVGG
jgi:hypothetical protein